MSGETIMELVKVSTPEPSTVVSFEEILIRREERNRCAVQVRANIGIFEGGEGVTFSITSPGLIGVPTEPERIAFAAKNEKERLLFWLRKMQIP